MSSVIPPRASAFSLFAAAEKSNLHPQWLGEYGLFTILVGKRARPIFFTFLPINSALSHQLALNKHTTHLLLDAAKLPAIEWCVTSDLNAAQTFLQRCGKVVAKPVLGQKAQGISYISSPDELLAVDLAQVILEKYTPGTEYRCLVLQGKVVGAHYKVRSNKLEYTTVKLTALPTPLEQLAIAAAAAIDLTCGAVDLIHTQAGQWVVLEINSQPGLWPFEHPDHGDPQPVADQILAACVAHYSQLSN